MPVVDKMKFTDTSFSMLDSIPVISLAVKYALSLSGEKSALSMTTEE